MKNIIIKLSAFRKRIYLHLSGHFRNRILVNSLSAIAGLLLFCMLGCIEEVNLNKLNGPTTNSLVVEGSITTEKKRHAVKLSGTGPAIINTTADLAPYTKVIGAKVTIDDGKNYFELREIDSLPGFYLTADIVQGEVGKTYTLTIELDGKKYQGAATLEPVSPFDPVEDLFNLPNRLQNPIENNFEVFELEFGKVRYGALMPSKQIFYSLDPMDSIIRSAYYYEFPGVDPQGFLLNFANDNQELFFVEGSVIFQLKHSMSKEHHKFISAVYDETKFRGGIYDRIQGNVPTNMNNGALGFFSASEVISRSFIITKEMLDKR